MRGGARAKGKCVMLFPLSFLLSAPCTHLRRGAGKRVNYYYHHRHHHYHYHYRCISHHDFKNHHQDRRRHNYLRHRCGRHHHCSIIVALKKPDLLLLFKTLSNP